MVSFCCCSAWISKQKALYVIGKDGYLKSINWKIKRKKPFQSVKYYRVLIASVISRNKDSNKESAKNGENKGRKNDTRRTTKLRIVFAVHAEDGHMFGLVFSNGSAAIVKMVSFCIDWCI